MKKLVITVALGLLLPFSVSAGQIYGSLKEDRRAVPAKVKIQMNCWDQSNKEQAPYVGYTDSYGAYIINITVRGKCLLTLPNYRGQTPKFDTWIYSYDKPLRYDFDLVNENGLYRLKRK